MNIFSAATDVIMDKQTVVPAAPEQKGTTRGADAITESPYLSPQQRSAAVTIPITLVTSLKNDWKQDNQKKRRSGMKAFLVTKSKNAAGKEPTHAYLLRMKTTVMSKSAATAKKLQREAIRKHQNLLQQQSNKPLLGNPQFLLLANRRTTPLSRS